jgi:glutathione S-transferase
MILYFHPFSSYCQKVLIALYEGGIAFEPREVNLGKAEERATLTSLWPFSKFPVLQDGERVVAESSIIIEYLERYRAGLIPGDPEEALEARLMDRIFDNHVETPLQTLVFEHIRPDGDMVRAEEARARLAVAYDLIEERLEGRRWAAGEQFSIADCSAAPALFYAGLLSPFGERSNLTAYFDRLLARPSFARAIEEARRFRHFFPVPTSPADWPEPRVQIAASA